MPITATPAAPALRRVLGRWDLTAIGVNQVIGGAIFLMPSQVAAQIGGWSPIAFVLMGLASMTRRTLLRGSREPIRRHGRPVPLHSRGIRSLRRVRGGLDAMVHAGRKPGERDGRYRRRDRLLLAVDDRGLATRAAAHRRHLRTHLGQRARHPSKRLGRQCAHDRQAAAAHPVHCCRTFLH